MRVLNCDLKIRDNGRNELKTDAWAGNGQNEWQRPRCMPCSLASTLDYDREWLIHNNRPFALNTSDVLNPGCNAWHWNNITGSVVRSN